MKNITRNQERSGIDELIKIKLVKINKCICEIKKKFFSENDKEKKIKLYIEMIKKIHDVISKIKIKKVLFTHLIDIYFADDNNNVYYTLKLQYSKYCKSYNSTHYITQKELVTECQNYIYGQSNVLNSIDTQLLNFIEKVNKLTNKEWQNMQIGNKNVYSYKSGSTTTFTSADGVEYTIGDVGGNYDVLTNGNYNGLRFNAGYNSTLAIDYAPQGTLFGVLAVGGGGNGVANIVNDGSVSSVASPVWSGGGGGGGGTFYVNNLTLGSTKSTIQIGTGGVYNLTVGKATQATTYGANNIICYPGQNGTTYEGGQMVSLPPYPQIPTTPAYGQVFFYNNTGEKASYAGGWGGDPSWSGGYSQLTSVTLPIIPNTQIPLGGGGGGGIGATNIYVSDSFYGRGGAGVGGASVYEWYNTGNSYGAAYGGGGGGSYGCNMSGGPGVFIIYWNV